MHHKLFQKIGEKTLLNSFYEIKGGDDKYFRLFYFIYFYYYYYFYFRLF